MFFNPIIRYFLLNILKLDLIAMVVIAGLRDSADQLYIAIPFLIAINIIPLFFSWCLMRNKKKLHYKNKLQTIGTMYEGLKIRFYKLDTQQTPNRLVIAYPMVFIFRRTLFAAITVFLFDWPNMQFVAHYTTSMLYLAYLS